jgi:hypothetical protein
MVASDKPIEIPPLAVIDARIEASRAEIEHLKRLRRAAKALLSAEQAREQAEQYDRAPDRSMDD